MARAIVFSAAFGRPATRAMGVARRPPLSGTPTGNVNLTAGAGPTPSGVRPPGSCPQAAGPSSHEGRVPTRTVRSRLPRGAAQCRRLVPIQRLPSRSSYSTEISGFDRPSGTVKTSNCSPIGNPRSHEAEALKRRICTRLPFLGWHAGSAQAEYTPTSAPALGRRGVVVGRIGERGPPDFRLVPATS